MRFSSKEDINAPIDAVFEAVTDFDYFERTMLQRGAQVTRVDANTDKGVGMCWDVGFKYRGRSRQARAEITTFEQPEELVINSVVGGINGDMNVAMISLGKNQTRLKVILDIKPQTLPARLLVQSLKLAQGSLRARFDARIAGFAKSIEKQANKAR